MRYLLDTNVCIEFTRRRGNSALRRRVISVPPADLAVSAITAYELLIGTMRKCAPMDEPAVIEKFLTAVDLLLIGEGIVRTAASIQQAPQSNGMPIGNFDALIAATALAHELTLITHNASEFDRVPSLQMEDWQT